MSAAHGALLAGFGEPSRHVGEPPAGLMRSVIVVGPPAVPAERSGSAGVTTARPELPPTRAHGATAPAPSPAGRGEVVPATPRWPTYATQAPSAFSRHYRLRRGDAVGHGVLEWQPDGERYAARFSAELGAHSFHWESRGGFDTAGVAPQRYVDRRSGRGARAASFLRDDGRIAYSGPAVEHPLLPGAQDRLSWLVQLAAILRARAAMPSEGEVLTLFVSGVRGDADRWDFVVEGVESIATPGGQRSALRLTREPRRRYDVRVQIWLDEMPDHLPVRVLTTPTGPAPAQEWIVDDDRPSD